jgi:hypothetical protein
MKFMKRFTLAIVLATLVLCLPLDSHAEFYDGNQLVDMMREWEKGVNKMPNVEWGQADTFAGYVVGVWDATANDYNRQGDITVGQICSIVAKYLKDNPEKWSLSAVRLVKEALRKAFPKR